MDSLNYQNKALASSFPSSGQGKQPPIRKPSRFSNTPPTHLNTSIPSSTADSSIFNSAHFLPTIHSATPPQNAYTPHPSLASGTLPPFLSSAFPPTPFISSGSSAMNASIPSHDMPVAGFHPTPSSSPPPPPPPSPPAHPLYPPHSTHPHPPTATIHPPTATIHPPTAAFYPITSGFPVPSAAPMAVGSSHISYASSAAISRDALSGNSASTLASQHPTAVPNSAANNALLYDPERLPTEPEVTKKIAAQAEVTASTAAAFSTTKDTSTDKSSHNALSNTSLNLLNFPRFEYFESESPYVCPLKFATFPPPLHVEPKLLGYTLLKDNYCSYKPTAFEFIASNHMTLPSAIHSSVFERLHFPPADSYTSTTHKEPNALSLNSTDLDIVAAVLPDIALPKWAAHNPVEPSLNMPREGAPKIWKAPANNSQTMEALSKSVDVIRIRDGGSNKLLEHPTRKDLKAKHVFNCIPHPSLCKNQYIQVGIEDKMLQMDSAGMPRNAFVLHQLSTSRGKFVHALYSKGDASDAMATSATAGGSVPSPYDGQYTFQRLYTSPYTDLSASKEALLLELPLLQGDTCNTSDNEGPKVAYFTALFGKKQIYSKSESKRLPPLEVIYSKAKPPTEALVEGPVCASRSDASPSAFTSISSATIGTTIGVAIPFAAVATVASDRGRVNSIFDDMSGYSEGRQKHMEDTAALLRRGVHSVEDSSPAVDTAGNNGIFLCAAVDSHDKEGVEVHALRDEFPPPLPQEGEGTTSQEGVHRSNNDGSGGSSSSSDCSTNRLSNVRHKAVILDSEEEDG